MQLKDLTKDRATDSKVNCESGLFMFFASCKTRFCDLGTKSTHFQCLTLDAINRHLKSIRQTWQSCGKWYPNVCKMFYIFAVYLLSFPLLFLSSTLPLPCLITSVPNLPNSFLIWTTSIFFCLMLCKSVLVYMLLITSVTFPFLLDPIHFCPSCSQGATAMTWRLRSRSRFVVFTYSNKYYTHKYL